ncbi:MAG: regulatory iron-sulfur-containing complex subunit RicT [Patescibacteria group bacterium]|jgi:cell fate regulator YaaT (PSP1 superfamily)
MQIIQIKFCPWDKEYDFSNENNLELKRGDKAIVETDIGVDVGEVISVQDVENSKKADLKTVSRLASADDIKKMSLSKKDKEDMMAYCRSLVKRHSLPMKIIDVHCSYDDSRLKFAFIADGRIDFRELVKDLARHYQKSIILHQVGIRDEAKISGDIGRCGVMTMCCKKFLVELGGINSEMAENQQIAHRGSERLSGTCGRLMCCLQFENEGYQEMAKNLPPTGSIVKYEGLPAEVIGWHTLKKSVDLKVKSKDGGFERLFDIPVSKIKVKIKK